MKKDRKARRIHKGGDVAIVASSHLSPSLSLASPLREILLPILRACLPAYQPTNLYGEMPCVTICVYHSLPAHPYRPRFYTR